MLTLTNLSYTHPNRDLLFDDINLTLNKSDKIALIGNNGIGKSSLLKILAGELIPSSGTITTDSKPYYVPQHVGQFNNDTIAKALHIDQKLKALRDITAGEATESNLAILDDDWLLEERCYEALNRWALSGIDLDRKMETLSGGQKTKVFLAGAIVNRADIVLLDEPSNHLDTPSRDILYEYVKTTPHTLVVVSHDRTLLNHLKIVYELNKQGISIYGGNYDFYAEQKEIEANALLQDLKSKEKSLRKAKEVERESMERKQKLDARGKKKQEKSGLPTIMMNTLRNKAEKSTSRIKDVHAEKIEGIALQLSQIRKELPEIGKMKIDLDNSSLHRDKRLMEGKGINIAFQGHPLWKKDLDFLITSGERMVIKGANGSGKTTLIKILLGELQPQSGTIERADLRSVYIDQDYSLIENKLTVYEQVQKFNHDNLQEHELKIRLNRFLFTKEAWDKSCSSLSGGEKMRLILCCLMISNQAPDILVLDEPTNNLDIQNTEILTAAIADYQGTLIIVSHDNYFLKQLNVQQEILLY